MSARRAYEYPVDDIRLTLLSNQGVVQHVRQLFAFEVASVNQPIETFGPVPNSFPPGLVFDYGITPLPDGEPTPVRFIHIEQNRIVIDVAGTSSAGDVAFARLNEALVGIRGPDGRRAIGDPVRIRDYSEIRFRSSLRVESIVREGVFAAAAEALVGPAKQAGASLVPVFQLRLARSEEEYRGGAIPVYETWSLDLRAGTQPADRIFYSGAPLNTDAHLALLEQIEEVLAPSGD